MKLETVLSWPSVSAVRKQYGYSGTWVYSLLSRGLLRGFQINGRWRIDPQSIEQFESRARRWKRRKGQSTDVPAISLIDAVLSDLKPKEQTNRD